MLSHSGTASLVVLVVVVVATLWLMTSPSAARGSLLTAEGRFLESVSSTSNTPHSPPQPLLPVLWNVSSASEPLSLQLHTMPAPSTSAAILVGYRFSLDAHVSARHIQTGVPLWVRCSSSWR